MGKPLGIILGAFFGILLLLSGAAAMHLFLPKASAAAAANGQIVFVSNRDGNYEIYAMNPDGSGQKNLSNNPSFEESPAWSPDGSKIVFSTTREGGGGQIYVMNADGSNPTKIADSRALGFDWSPDGSKIAFSDFVDQTSQIFTMNVDGTGIVQLTHTLPNLGAAGPAWSPDGSKIAFISSDSSGEVHVMNADGTGETTVVQSPLIQSPPTWSPDGTKLAFVAFENGAYDIFVINADGSGAQTNITHNTDILEMTPTWSPDGSKIAFAGSKGDIWGIYTANADATGQIESLDTAGLFPNWGVHQPTANSSNFQLRVASTDLAGNSLAGMWTVVRSAADGSVVQSGYTPLTLTSNTGGEYTVAIQGYADRTFNSWSDGIASNTRSLVLTSNTTLTARFDVGDSLRDFTSLTYTGTPEQPDLTVNALSLDGSKSLRMWTIIDPQSSNQSGTTYKVYANNYKDRVFDHWNDGSTDRTRTLTISEPTTITAYYKTG